MARREHIEWVKMTTTTTTCSARDPFNRFRRADDATIFQGLPGVAHRVLTLRGGAQGRAVGPLLAVHGLSCFAWPGDAGNWVDCRRACGDLELRSVG